jgi:hypothetical protein
VDVIRVGAWQASAGSAAFFPKGHPDNSPAFQRRGIQIWIAQVPQGRPTITPVLRQPVKHTLQVPSAKKEKRTRSILFHRRVAACCPTPTRRPNSTAIAILDARTAKSVKSVD